jgi:hypothetical protein
MRILLLKHSRALVILAFGTFLFALILANQQVEALQSGEVISAKEKVPIPPTSGLSVPVSADISNSFHSHTQLRSDCCPVL